MEAVRKLGYAYGKVLSTNSPQLGEDVRRGQEFTCNSVAGDLLAACTAGRNVGNSATAEPDMGEFVQKRKESGGRCIGRVNKDDRGQRVADRKASELTYVELPTGVIADDATTHHQYPSAFSRFDQLTVVRFPTALPLLDIDFEYGANVLRYLYDVGTRVETAHEWQRLRALILKVLDEPSLPLHCVLDSFREVDTGLAGWGSANGTKVRQHRLLGRGLVQEEITERRMQRICDLLGLSEGRLRVTFFPALELLRFNANRCRCLAHIETDTTTCPAKHCWVNKSVRVGHRPILRKQPVYQLPTE